MLFKTGFRSAKVSKCVKQISTGAAFELQLLFVLCERQKENRNRTNDSKYSDILYGMKKGSVTDNCILILKGM